MGKLFAIEGTDGSGKQTQFNKLCERLKQDGIDFRTVSFPNYESNSSALVKMYLSGEFGTDPQKISPYIATTFYIADIPVICENINVIVLKTTLQIIHFLKICVNHRRNIYGLSKTEEDER